MGDTEANELLEAIADLLSYLLYNGELPWEQWDRYMHAIRHAQACMFPVLTG